MVLVTEEPPKVRPRTPRLVVVIGVVALVAGPVLMFPYLTFDPSRSRIPVTGLHYVVLAVHVVAATAALLLGVLQLVPRLRARRLLHRWAGRAFLLLGVLAFGVTGIPLALTTPEGNMTRYGILLPAVGWVVCAALGWTAIRQGRIAAHREWMIRTYALTFFALTARMVVPLLVAAQMPFETDRNPDAVRELIDSTIPYGQWLGWIINLAIAEYVVRRLRRTDPAGPLPRSPVSGLRATAA